MYELEQLARSTPTHSCGACRLRRRAIDACGVAHRHTAGAVHRAATNRGGRRRETAVRNARRRPVRVFITARGDGKRTISYKHAMKTEVLTPKRHCLRLGCRLCKKALLDTRRRPVRVSIAAPDYVSDPLPRYRNSMTACSVTKASKHSVNGS